MLEPLASDIKEEPSAEAGSFEQHLQQPAKEYPLEDAIASIHFSRGTSPQDNTSSPLQTFLSQSKEQQLPPLQDYNAIYYQTGSIDESPIIVDEPINIAAGPQPHHSSKGVPRDNLVSTSFSNPCTARLIASMISSRSQCNVKESPLPGTNPSSQVPVIEPVEPSSLISSTPQFTDEGYDGAEQSRQSFAYAEPEFRKAFLFRRADSLLPPTSSETGRLRVRNMPRIRRREVKRLAHTKPANSVD